MEKLPIKLDTILKRYLHDIEFEYDRKNQGLILDKADSPNCVTIDTHTLSEMPVLSHQSCSNFLEFQKFFEDKQVMKFHSYEEYLKCRLRDFDEVDFMGKNTNIIEFSDPYFCYHYEEKLVVEVLDIDFIRKFRKKFCFILDDDTFQKLKDDNSKLFYMNPNGSIFYGKDRNEVSIKLNMDTEYYKIFVCIYLCTYGGGRTSFNEVNAMLGKRFGITLEKPKSIQNAFNLSLKKYFPIVTPTGEKLVDCTKDGKILFNNPLVILS